MVGFVRFPRSPRHVGWTRAALCRGWRRARAERVLLMVDPDDRGARRGRGGDRRPDLIQLHGRETPERVAAIRARTGRPVMKAIGIADAADLGAARRLPGAADRILLDAKPPAGAACRAATARPSTGRSSPALDPRLDPTLMLSGGLDPDNVAGAIAATGVAGGRRVVRGREPAGREGCRDRSPPSSRRPGPPSRPDRSRKVA